MNTELNNMQNIETAEITISDGTTTVTETVIVPDKVEIVSAPKKNAMGKRILKTAGGTLGVVALSAVAGVTAQYVYEGCEHLRGKINEKRQERRERRKAIGKMSREEKRLKKLQSKVAKIEAARKVKDKRDNDPMEIV